LSTAVAHQGASDAFERDLVLQRDRAKRLRYRRQRCLHRCLLGGWKDFREFLRSWKPAHSRDVSQPRALKIKALAASPVGQSTARGGHDDTSGSVIVVANTKPCIFRSNETGGQETACGPGRKHLLKLRFLIASP
jgi:hypothetical protein